MKKVCSWSKKLKESKSYKEMLGVVLNMRMDLVKNGMRP